MQPISRNWIILGGAALLTVFVVGSAAADETFLFDEKTGDWVGAESAEAAPEGLVGEAQALLKAGQYGKAEKLLKDPIKKRELDEKARPAAMVVYADCAYMRGDFYEAYKRYQKVVEEYPDTVEFALSLRRELDIAKAWLEGKKRRLWGMFPVSAEDEALDILTRIEERAPGKRIAEVALKMKADYYYDAHKYDEAETAYRRLLRDYPSKRYRQMAARRAADAADARFAGAPFDETPLLEATELYRQYLDQFPQSTDHAEIEGFLQLIQAKRAEKNFQVGKFYQRVRQPRAAAYYFNYVLKTWPETLWADRSRAEMERMGFEPGAPVVD